MASAPSYAATPRMGAGKISVANTDKDTPGTGTVVTLFTAGALGSKINRMVIHSPGNPADCVVPVFLFDGTLYYVIHEFDLGNPNASAATVPGYHDEKRWDDLVIPTGWSLRATITVSLTAGNVHATVWGGDF